MTGAKDGRRAAGELEADVMAALRAAAGPQTPGQVRLSLGAGLARTTVATILSRLHGKGIAGRRRQARGYAYFPVQDAHGLTARRMHTELDRDSALTAPRGSAPTGLLRLPLSAPVSRYRRPRAASDTVGGPAVTGPRSAAAPVRRRPVRRAADRRTGR